MNQEINKENIVLCFCKHPIAGLVKSRLAKEIGEEQAVEAYKILLDETVNTLNTLNFKVFLYCYPDINHSTFNRYEAEFNFTLKNQHGKDLGTKMHKAIESHLNANTNVVLIGSDCLEIDAAYIHKAFEYLDTGSDIVLGPAVDGGYALIGTNKMDRSIFEDINWSTNQVLAQTKEKINNLNWRYSLLNKVRDLDNLDDYKYFTTHDKYLNLFT